MRTLSNGPLFAKRGKWIPQGYEKMFRCALLIFDGAPTVAGRLIPRPQ